MTADNGRQREVRMREWLKDGGYLISMPPKLQRPLR